MAASGQLLKDLHDPADYSSALFIRQSTRSNYCGVYSTGMLLSLLGWPTTRYSALALFDLERSNPDFAGATHGDMGRLFAQVAKIKLWRWDSFEEFDFASISKSLRAHFSRTGCPTLLSFRVIHKNGKWRCGHVAVATGTTGGLIELIDPLASKPGVYRGSNVLLQKEAWSKTVRVIGNSYRIDRRSEAAVLRWSFAA